MGYVSVEDATKSMLKHCEDVLSGANVSYETADIYRTAYQHAIGDIKALPAVDVPERNVGKWILVREADETGNALYECSACHMSETHSPIVEVKYCWNCGAKMEDNE